MAALEATGLGDGLDRRRRRPRPCVSLHRSRRPRLRALLRGRALRGARAPAAVLAEPAPAVRRAGRGGQAARPRQRARRGRARRTGCSRRSARVPPLRADRARRWHRGGRVAEPFDRGARADLRRRRVRRQRPASPPRVLGRHARGVPARRGPFRGQRDPHRGGALEARDRPGVLPVRLRAGREPGRGDDRRLLRLRPRLRADRRGRQASAPTASSGACRRSRASTRTERRTSRARRDGHAAGAVRAARQVRGRSRDGHEPRAGHGGERRRAARAGAGAEPRTRGSTCSRSRTTRAATRCSHPTPSGRT